MRAAGRVVNGVMGLMHVVDQLLVGLSVRARSKLCSGPLSHRRLRDDLPGKPDPKRHHALVVAVGVGEVTRVDAGTVAEITRAQLHRPSRLPRQTFGVRQNPFSVVG